TSLRTNLDVLQRVAQLPEADRRAVLESLALEVNELTNLVTELVELATDQTRDDEEPEPVHLGELADAVVQRARRRTGREIAVVKQIIDRHAGHVWATGRPDGGAAVGFDLPSTAGGNGDAEHA